MKTLKILTVTAMLMAVLAAVVMVSAATQTGIPDRLEATTSEPQSDAGVTYKSKCVACHGQKAEKKFDSSLPDAQLIDAVMKGKKPEKPPNMPAYAEKGVSAEQAKALVDYMKELRSTP